MRKNLAVRNFDLGLSVRSAGLQIREVSKEGEFEGYLSVFDEIDSYGTVFRKGAFATSLREKTMKDIKLLGQHRPDNILGEWLEIKEDDTGLWGRGQLFMDDTEAQRYHRWMSAGVLDGISVGFWTKKSARVEDEEDGSVFYELLDVDLWEASLVTFPANKKAKVRQSLDPNGFMDIVARETGLPRDEVQAIWTGRAAPAGRDQSLTTALCDEIAQAFKR